MGPFLSISFDKSKSSSTFLFLLSKCAVRGINLADADRCLSVVLDEQGVKYFEVPGTGGM